MRNVKYEDLSELEKKALDSAAEVLENSYNPYSHFYVGAALLCDDGAIVSGTNFENAAYGSTICAERAAVLRANSTGHRKFTAIAIIGRGENFDTTEVTSPCGSCRQILYEASQISGRDMDVILSTTKKDKIIIATTKELLPLAFGPLDLGIDLSKYRK